MSAKDLRLALCMRGGVSLAVWMGGACREIAALRTAKTHPPAPAPVRDADIIQVKIYDSLLELSGYSQVTVDVIAGTSAGGLNGVLFATHLVYGMRFDTGVRDTWLRVGDLELLTRRPGHGFPPSLLEGDEGFYVRLLDEMRKLLKDSQSWPPSTENSPRLVRLILTATRLIPRDDHIRPSIGPPMYASRSQAHLRFRHRRVLGESVEAEFTDFGESLDAVSLDRLAYAARTTSSFPVAFEPARPNVVRLPDDVTPTGCDLFGISSETGVPDGKNGHVEMMDGGVLDNVPLSWAIRAVAGAPAGAPVDRWLLYLQPVPPKPPEQTNKEGSLTRLFRAVQALVKAKFNSESLLDAAEELREAWTSAQRLQGAAGGLPGNPDLVGLPVRGELLNGYGSSLACVEADRLVRLVEDPVQVLGPDPLPIPNSRPLNDDPKWGQFLAELRGEAIPAIVSGPEVGVAGFRSLLAPARAVTLALDWMYTTENELSVVTKSQTKALRKARESLYEVRFACEVLLAARDRLLLHALAPDIAVVDWMRRTGRQLDLVVALHGGLDAPGSWHSVLAAVSKDCILGRGLPDPGEAWPDPFMLPLWQQIARICRKFGRSMGAAADVVGFRALSQASAEDSADVMLELLDAAELMLGPLRPDPFSEPTRIRFHTMSAAAESPLENQLIQSDRPTDEPARVKRKLSGNQLFNFASFLSSRWRLNDWTWGRLDSACSLVDIVARPERLRGTSDQDLLKWLRTLHEELSLDRELADLIGSWADQHVDQSTVRDRLLCVVTTWLHWNILRQEIPVLAALTADRSDVPPTSTQLANAAATKDMKLAESVRVLGDVGGESVRHLLRKPHLRRAGFRLGLVAWRAIQPDGNGMAHIPHVGFAMAKPLIAPPLLIGVLAPFAGLLAAVLGWGAVSTATNLWFSPPGHLFVALGAAVAVTSTCWHRELVRKVAKVGFLALAVFVMLSVIGWLFLENAPLPGNIGGVGRTVLVGGLAAAGVFTSLWGVAAISIRSGRGSRLRFVAMTSVVPGVIASLGFGLIGDGRPVGGWAATGILYATLAIETILLTYVFPAAPEPE